MKKTIISLILAVTLGFSAFAFTGCNNQDNALNDAYNAYVSSLSNASNALSFNEWLTLIKSGDTFANESDLDTIYSAYAAAYGTNAMSFDEWKAAISSFSGLGATVSIDDNGQVTVAFKNGNSLLITFDEFGRIGEVHKDLGLSFYDEKNHIYHPYKRTDAGESGNSITFTMPEYSYRYVSFNPEQSANDVSATGIYRISAGGKTISQFAANPYFAQTDENNVPTNIIAISGTAPQDASNPDIYSGQNYIEIKITQLNLGQTFFFMLTSGSEQEEITITIERVNDAKQVIYNSITPIAETTYTASQIPLIDGLTTSFSLVPVDGSVVIVYNETDKLYHVGSVDGPLLAVQMNNAVSRVSVSGIKAIIEALDVPETDAITPFRTSVTEETATTITITTYDYTSTVRSYLAMVNSQGFCHVDKTMMNILKAYVPKTEGSATVIDEYEWLLPCSYIVEG